jgi:hypothetical protein
MSRLRGIAATLPPASWRHRGFYCLTRGQPVLAGVCLAVAGVVCPAASSGSGLIMLMLGPCESSFTATLRALGV